MTGAIGINFHGIGTPGRPLEPGEAPFWLDEAQFLRILDDVTRCEAPDRYVITFDDGNLSDRTIALPALQERGLRAAFFVLSGRIGVEGSLDGGDIRALIEAGMGIGSHGIDHRPWSTLNDVELARELTASKHRLEAVCGSEIREAAIPFGRYDARVLRALRRAGYAAAYSSDGGRMSRAAFLRPRTSLRGDMTAQQVASVLEGGLAPSRRFRRALGLARRRFLPLR